MNADDIRFRLDLDHIAEMALHAGTDLQSGPCAYVVLTPNDGTRYDVVITRRQFWLLNRDGEIVRERLRGFLVTLTNLGGSYIWEGIQLRPDYVADKWCNGHEWTGIVLCEFLNVLVGNLPEDDRG